MRRRQAHSVWSRPMSSIDRCRNAQDFRALARRRLPAPLFHYIDGGADDEWTLRRNTQAFNDAVLLPGSLNQVAGVQLATHVLGADIALPLFLSPTGMTRLFHPDGERAVARAADAFGTIYALSTLATVSIEEIGALTEGAKCFQIYIHKDRSLTDEFIDRARTAGFTSLCLTVDTLVAGNRERDLATGMVMPPRFDLAGLASFATHPRWALGYLSGEPFRLANVHHRIAQGSDNLVSVMDYVNAQFDPTIGWADAERAVVRWGGPFAIKGILTAEDARRAIDIGATAVMISNHGGRQLDGAPAPFDQLTEIADAVAGRAEIILDGGVRRGTHVLKALACGADACSIGRAYLYALAAGGEKGVRRALTRLRDELHRDMILMGLSDVAQLTPERMRWLQGPRGRAARADLAGDALAGHVSHEEASREEASHGLAAE